jgi:hypothetical protein
MKKLLITILIIFMAGVLWAGETDQETLTQPMEKPKKGIYFSETDDGKLHIDIVGYTGITEAARLFLLTVADQYFVKYKALTEELKKCEEAFQEW